MAITVKYRHGDLEYSRIGGSASQVRQVLETIQEDLVARCGQYTSRQKGDDVLKKESRTVSIYLRPVLETELEARATLEVAREVLRKGGDSMHLRLTPLTLLVLEVAAIMKVKEDLFGWVKVF